MKNHPILTVLCIMLTLSSCKTMQMGPKAAPDDLFMEKIVQAQGKTKDQLYVKANSWFVDNFNDAESVIQFQDKESGKLMGKYVSNAKISIYNYLIKSTIEIDIKDNKAKLLFKDPYFKTVSDDTGNTYNESYKPLDSKDGVMQARKNWNALAMSFEKFVNENDDW